jgi:antitoxin ParD1/3/4
MSADLDTPPRSLDMPQHRRREDALKLKALRVRIKAGAEALARGDYIEIEDADLDAFLGGLGPPTIPRARR